jgi:hypothetical protein
LAAAPVVRPPSDATRIVEERWDARHKEVAMNSTHSRADRQLLGRIRSEFLEMPALCLTVRQAARLWNVDIRTSESALRLLVSQHFLHQTTDGQYVASASNRQPRC